jgi:hypothetical protein
MTLKINDIDSSVFSIDLIVSIETTICFTVLDYEIIHRLPYQNASNGKIFLRAFDTGLAQFDDECFPYYEDLTQRVASVTGGTIETRYHPRNFVIIPKTPTTPKDIIDWFDAYQKITEWKNPKTRIRYKQP